ncbi:hypothetical protein KFE25_008928 [Diacronema lutheri]|uniref:Zinc-finger domain-containing protein n=1 Tax=Diacronema lutheri TaxID=2081491 RepID=A0A8J5XXS5_DIALT|nr:hypothetical protein KFE25_008928 [Diacronema lutheri]
MKLRYEPSFLPSHWVPLDRPPRHAGLSERAEASLFAGALAAAASLPASVFRGGAAGAAHAAHSAVRSADLLASAWYPPAPRARTEEVFTAYSLAVEKLDRLAGASIGLLTPGASSDTAGGQLAGAPGAARATKDDERHAAEIGWCHQCKRKGQILRCEHSQPIDVTRDGLMRLEVVQCRRPFCLGCLAKYPDESPDEPLYRKGKLRCPSCRGLCACKSCQRTRAGGHPRVSKSKKHRPAANEPTAALREAGALAMAQPGARPLAPLALPASPLSTSHLTPTAAAGDSCATVALSSSAQAPSTLGLANVTCAPNALNHGAAVAASGVAHALPQLRAQPETLRPQVQSPPKPLQPSQPLQQAQPQPHPPTAALRVPTPSTPRTSSLPGVFRKCIATCPQCRHEHRLRVRRVAAGFAPIVPYTCTRCTQLFHLKLASAAGAGGSLAAAPARPPAAPAPPQ